MLMPCGHEEPDPMPESAYCNKCKFDLGIFEGEVEVECENQVLC